VILPLGTMTPKHPPSSIQATTPGGDSVGARVLSLLRSHGDRVFLRYADAKLNVQEMTYRNFFTYVMIVAHLYDRVNVPVGGTVVLVLSNPKDVFLAETAALLTGRIPIVSAHPSPKLSLADFSRTLLPLIDNAEASLIVSDAEYSSYLSAAIGRRVVRLDLIVPKALPQVVSTDFPTLFIQYSSGTTGTKKGVSISGKQLLWQVDAYARDIGLRAGDHIVSWLPYYHDMGLITALMMPLLTATPVTIMSPFDWVKNPLMLLEIISRDYGTLTWLPNFAYNFLAQAAHHGDISRLNLSRLRGVINCSEPVSAASHTLFLETFAKCGLRATALAASYAMAETTFAITSGGFKQPLRIDYIDRAALHPGEAVTKGTYPVVSSGHALPGTDVKIMGTDGREMLARHVGEIAVRSPSLMNGYVKNAGATQKAYRDGFFLTGDLGYVDDHDVFVTGRIKDLIITAGRNIYPQDIEAVVNDLPHIISGRCVAFGIEDSAKGTESVIIVAERVEDPDVDSRSIATAISQAVTARFDISLGDVRVVSAGWLKKSTSGKIARAQNRDRYLAEKVNTTVRPGVMGTTAEDIVRSCVHEATGIWVTDPEAPLVTAGVVDSLALTTLLLALEGAFNKAPPAPEVAGYDAYDSIAAIVRAMAGDHQNKPLPQNLPVDRQIKANCVLEGPRDFDALIIGSSRSYLIRAKHAKKFGLRAFQFSVAGVRMEELYSIVAFFKHTNTLPLKQIIWGVDPIQFAPHLPLDFRFLKSPALMPYLDEVDRLGRGELQGDDIDTDGLSRTLRKQMQVRYNAWDFDFSFDPVSGDFVQVFGQKIATMPPLNYDTEKSSGQWVQQFLTAKQLTHLHPRRLYYLQKLFHLTRESGCKLAIYTNPLHPLMIAKLAENTQYLTLQDSLLAHIRATAHSGVTVHPLLTPSDFGGSDGDYYDGVHMGRFNGDRLLGHLMSAAQT
jgi:fatty-acyl-CoA synthase